MPLYTRTAGISNTIDLIQAKLRAVTGVVRAPNLADMPNQINTVDLPFVVTWPSSGEFHQKGVGGTPYRQDRTYRIIVFIEPLGQSLLPQRAVDAAVLLQRFIEALLAPSAIALADPDGNGTYQVTLEPSMAAPFTDSGLRSDLQFGGTQYHGFEVTIRVRELWTVSST